MARKKGVSAGTIVGVGFGIIVLVAILDYTVLKGRLGLKGVINTLIIKLKLKSRGSDLSLPGITPAPLAPEEAETSGLPSGSEEFEGSPEEAALLQQEAELAAEEPETASLSRRFR